MFSIRSIFFWSEASTGNPFTHPYVDLCTPRFFSRQITKCISVVSVVSRDFFCSFYLWCALVSFISISPCPLGAFGLSQLSAAAARPSTNGLSRLLHNSFADGAHSANFNEKVHKPQSKSYHRIGANMQLTFTRILWSWIFLSVHHNFLGFEGWCINPI